MLVTVNAIGFTRLSANLQPPKKGIANIIFIHGLRGHPQRTWTTNLKLGDGLTGNSNGSLGRRRKSKTFENSPLQTEIFWPEELLVPDIPEAHIWTYGYNADYSPSYHASNKNSILQHGQDLAVKLQRDIDNHEPIILVAYSLGGILVKEAISRPDSDVLRRRTQLIIFLGTPHRGSKYASWGTIVSSLAQTTLLDSNRRVLEALQLHDGVLDGIHQRFVNVVGDSDIQIHSFQETRGVAGVKGLHGKVVPDFSSKLDLPGETVETIDGNHREMIRCESRDDPRYRAISTVLKKSLGRNSCGPGGASLPKLSKKVVFMVPFPQDPMFVGREDIFKRLGVVREVGGGLNAHARVALVGLGGIGKSQVAIEYAYRARARKPGLTVLWIHASTPTRFEQGYRDFAREADLPGRNHPEIHILELVRNWLSNEDHGHWLMVLDNVDSDDDWFVPRATLKNDGEKQAPLETFLPQSPNGTILVTSRNSVAARKLLGDYGRPVYVERMVQDDALDLLRSKVRFEESLEEDAKALVHALEGIPLAITQAAAYIRTRERFDVSRYLNLFHESESNMAILLNNEDSMQDLRRDPSTRVPVITTWQITIDKIWESSPKSADLLALMSMFDHQEIPKALLDKGLDALRFEEYIAPLMSYSLVREQTQKDDFGMHRLVQLATRAWLMKNGNLRKWKSKAIKIVAENFPTEDLMQPRCWPVCQALLPHTRELVGTIPTEISHEDVHNIATILKASAWYISERNGEYKGAEIYLRDAFKLCKEYLGLGHRTTIQCLELMSSVLRIQQQLDQAEPIGRQALELCKQHLDIDDADTVKAQSRLSLILLRKKEYQEAETLMRIARKAWISNFGLQDGYANLFTANLATALASQNKYDEAEPLAQQAAEGMNEVLGEDHPDNLIHRNILAGILEKREKYDQAEELYRRTLSVRDEMLGPNHPRTLAASRSLVRVLEKQGKHDEALPLRPKAKEAISKGYDDSI